ncbi:MAG TPA: DUF6069 family protein [Thermomicrobiales bacterium]|nr:DUF6069 family protein [Thermomicrobiales bacterium]
MARLPSVDAREERATHQPGGDIAGAVAPPPAAGRRVDYRRLLWVGPLAAVAAACACVAVYAVAAAAGAIPRDVLVPGPAGTGPLTPGSVAGAAIIGALAAAVVFALIGLVSSRPVGLFRVVALVALALSLATPATIAGAPAGMRAALLAMHVLVAAISVGLLTTLAASPATIRAPRPGRRAAG